MTWAIKPQKPSDETLVFLPSRGEECVNLTVYSVDQDVSGGAAVTYHVGMNWLQAMMRSNGK